MKPSPWLLALISTSLLTACTADKESTSAEPKSTSPEPVVKVKPVEVVEEAPAESSEETEKPKVDENALLEEAEELNDESSNSDIAEENDLQEEEEEENTTALIEDAPELLSGSFSYDTSYPTPKGTTEMEVVFRVDNGVVNGVDLKGNPKHQISVQHQILFATGLDDYVIGKKIETIEPLSAIVNGSSLTAPAFNEALARLKKEA